MWPHCGATQGRVRTRAGPGRRGDGVRAEVRLHSSKGGSHATDRARPGLGDDFDVLDPRYVDDPFSIWDDLRQTCPIAHTDRRKSSWLPTRYDDVTAIAHDIEHFSSIKVAVIPGDEDEDPRRLQRAEPRVRLAAHFGGPAAAHLDPAPAAALVLAHAGRRLRALTRELCRRLLDGFADAGHADAAADYAQQIPVRVIAHILGVSTDLSDTFTGWVRDVLEFADDAERRRARRRGAARLLRGPARVPQGQNPGDDLLSELLTTEVDGKPVDDGIVLGMAALVLIAGVDTTWSAIGSSLWHLAAHPDDRKRLVAEPELMPTAIEELLRAYSPVTMAREVTEDIEYARLPHEGGRQGPDELPCRQPRPRGVRAPPTSSSSTGPTTATWRSVGHPPLRRVEPGPHGIAGGARGVAGPHPRVLARGRGGDHLGGRTGPRAAYPAGGIPMKIRVDPEKCQGHARCYGLAPEIFDVDDYGQASVLLDEVPPELEEKARLAVANCPEYAIEIISRG